MLEYIERAEKLKDSIQKRKEGKLKTCSSLWLLCHCNYKKLSCCRGTLFYIISLNLVNCYPGVQKFRFLNTCRRCMNLKVTQLYLSLFLRYTYYLGATFYCAMLCIRGTSHGPMSVCVCLSQAGVPLKRQNVGSHKQHNTMPQGL